MRKSNKLWYLSIILVILVLILAACGGDDDDDNGDSDNGNGDNSSAVSFSESFQGTISGFDVQFNHPQGWVAQADNDMIAVASSRDVMELMGTSQTLEDFNAPDDAVGILILTLPSAAVENPAEFIGGIASEGGPLGTEVGSAEETTIGDQAAAKAPLSGDIDGEVYVVQYDDAYLVFVALSRTYSDQAGTVEALVASASVSADG